MRNVKPKEENYGLGSSPGVVKSAKSQPVYPRVRIELDTLPEAKKWEVGETYHLEMEVKMVGLSISRFDNSADFEIRKIGTDGAEHDAGSSKDEENDTDD